MNDARPNDTAASAPWWLRAALVVAGLLAWHGTQSLLGSRPALETAIGDAPLAWTATWNQYLHDHPRLADGLLIASSAVIDILGVFLLAMSIFGKTIRPFLGLLMLFGMRQICQSLCALQAPDGIIWRDPGVPSLLVTYDVANDFFFSGHTALAVLGSVELIRFGGWRLLPLGLLIIAFEAVVVLVLRAHYTMDVFTGAVVALYMADLAARCAPWCDAKLAGVGKH